MKTKINTVYFDMDGVLCDQTAYVKQNWFDLLEKVPRVGSKARSIFMKKAAASDNAFAKLPEMKDFHKLMGFIGMHSPTTNFEILTQNGIHRADDVTAAVRGKQQWLADRGLDVLQFNCVCKDQGKGSFASFDRLLIDDQMDNIRDFRARGGSAIHYKNYAQFKKIVDEEYVF